MKTTEKSIKILITAIDNMYINKMLQDLKKYDKYTYCHSINVAFECLLIGINLNLNNDDLLNLAYAGLLHDIGKTNININIINKEGKLTGEEFNIIKKHPIYGAKIIRECNQFNNNVIKSVLMHHENYDGTGYYHTNREALPLFSRIIRIADVYEAMTDKRSYHEKRNEKDVIKEMKLEVNKFFDPELFNIFINIEKQKLICKAN